MNYEKLIPVYLLIILRLIEFSTERSTWKLLLLIYHFPMAHMANLCLFANLPCPSLLHSILSLLNSRVNLKQFRITTRWYITSVSFDLTYHFPDLHHIRQSETLGRKYSNVNLLNKYKYMIIPIPISFSGSKMNNCFKKSWIWNY